MTIKQGENQTKLIKPNKLSTEHVSKNVTILSDATVFGATKTKSVM